MLVPYTWLKEYVDVALSPEELASKITMSSVEVESIEHQGNDAILNIAPTPNRGDCLSVIGVARDVAALTGKRVKLPKFAPVAGKGKMGDIVEIIVKDKKGCPRYTSRLVTGVKVGPSPSWLKAKVEAVGVRSINNVVDATNYVLMELGQPVHAFDLRFLKGSKLIIDRPKKDRKVVALDEAEYTFTPADILNMDAERPIGAAGIMGGLNSGVMDDTTTLVLESAYFDPMTVRRTSKRTGLASESSRRFEKGVDPEGVIHGLHRLTELIVKVAGGTPSADWVDLYPAPMKKAKIELTAERVNWLLGTELDTKTVVKLLSALGCEITEGAKGKLKVVAPSHRPDLTRPADLIEEVARLYGYDKIKASMPLARVSSLVKPPAITAEQTARDALVGAGFYEAMTYSFSSDAEEEKFGAAGSRVKLANPLTVDMVSMRTTIIPALLIALKNNLNRQLEDVRIFELAKVFMPGGGKLPVEKKYLSGVMTGRRRPFNWEGMKDGVDLFDAKAAVWSVFDALKLPAPEASPSERKFLHPADSFEMCHPQEVCHPREGGCFLSHQMQHFGSRRLQPAQITHPKGCGYHFGNNREGGDPVSSPIGFCGRLHPQLEREYDFASPVYIFELDFEVLKAASLKGRIIYKPVSRYPSMIRDVALLVNSSITHKELLQSFNKYVSNMVQSIELFDVYKGKGIPEGKKSMAYRVLFGSNERTLSDGEVDNAFAALVEGVKKDAGAEIR